MTDPFLRRATRAFLLTLTGVLAACSERETAAERIEIDNSGSAIEMQGIRLEVADDVRFRVVHTSTNGETTTATTLNGHPFGMRSGRFEIGDHDYGAVAPGTTVRVTAAGVFVNDVRRGPLPASRDG